MDKSSNHSRQMASWPLPTERRKNVFFCFLSLCSACRFVCALIVRDRLHASKKNAARAESPGRACPVIAQSEKFSDERRPTHVVALESVENTSLSLSCARVSHSFAVRVRDWLCFLARFISPLADKSPGAIRHEFVRLLLRFNQTKRYVYARTLHAGRRRMGKIKSR